MGQGRISGMSDKISMFPVANIPRVEENVAPVEQVLEAVPGEVELDAIVKAQSSAPHVADRMVKLENCIWSLAGVLLLLPEATREKIGATEAIEQARLLLHKSTVLDHNLELSDPQ
jgi:hypothetical protein